MGPITSTTKGTDKPRQTRASRDKFDPMNSIVMSAMLVAALVAAVYFGSAMITMLSCILLFVWFYFAPSLFMSSTDRRDHWEEMELGTHRDPHNVRKSRFHREPKMFQRLALEVRSNDPDDAKKRCPICGDLGTAMKYGKHAINDPNRMIECYCSNPFCRDDSINNLRETWKYLPTKSKPVKEN